MFGCSKMEEIRLFKLFFGGIWEEGPPHVFPIRNFKPVTFENGKMLHGEWVDAGMSEFPSFKYVGGKSLESRVPWDGDTTSIIELTKWIENGVDEFENNWIRIYWLWGKQRYELTKDIDLIYFWHHAPVNVDGFTEIIIDAEPVIPLAFDATNATDTLGKDTNCEEIIDLTYAETTDVVDDGDVHVDVDSGVETSTNHGEGKKQLFLCYLT
jgi:hypothetical protein